LADALEEGAKEAKAIDAGKERPGSMCREGSPRSPALRWRNRAPRRTPRARRKMADAPKSSDPAPPAPAKT